MLHLDLNDPDALTAFLQHRRLLSRDDAVRAVASAGEGNMNLVARVTTATGTLIVKQARPWVEKYPQIPAPADRDAVEAAFYTTVARVPAVSARMPRLLDHDPDHHVQVFEDLGEAADYSDLYAGAVLDDRDLEALLGWLDALHGATWTDLPPVLHNRAMRALNHQHVFVLPFREHNGLDLDAVLPGLGEVAAGVARDRALGSAVAALGERYLADGPSLLHGDFYPGSWLRTADGPRVLDPEFGFTGSPAFDRGVLLAHLLLSGQSQALLRRAATDAPRHTHGFAGVEVMRRLLGVAQLPLTADLATRSAWVARARAWVMDDA